MRISAEPLSETEVARVISLLEESGARVLPYARGVFAAIASAPTQLEPTAWLSLLLGEQVPNAGVLKELLGLLIRDYNSCADCLALGVPAVPHPKSSEDVTEFSKGFVHIAQKDKDWIKDQQAFALTVPLMMLSGYASAESLRSLVPEISDDPEAYVDQHRESLTDDVAAIYAHFAEARQKQNEPQVAAEKVGRNEACPCGSGKKYKKCCATAD